jgi:hypothetical protein
MGDFRPIDTDHSISADHARYFQTYFLNSSSSWMDGDFSIIVLMKFSLSAGEIMTRFDFPYLISILSNEQAAEDKGLRVLLISLISCKGILCLKGPQEIFNWFSEISYPVPNQIHPMNRMTAIMMMS